MTLPFLVSFFGCKDFVEIDPPQTEIVRENIFSSEESAEAAINGLYSISNGLGTMLGTDHAMLNGMLSDEFNFLATWNTLYLDGNRNEVAPDDSFLFSIWESSYRSINNANGVIEGLQENTSLSGNLRNQLLGEALFFRAFLHFQLTNFFGPIPYAISTDVETNNSIGKTDRSTIYQNIVEDLVNAQDLMTEVSNGIGRTRPTSYAATALLSRVYLYTENWIGAESAASEVIDQSELFSLTSDLNTVFLRESEEAIFQLYSEGRGIPGITPMGTLLIILGTPRFFDFGATELSSQQLSVFTGDDDRATDWVDTLTNSRGTWIFCGKYKNVGGSLNGPEEFITLLRLAEQYLIRSEARTRSGNLSGALEDLNTIRNRAGLSNVTLTDRSSIIDAIILERRRELFGEGHRWFDLNRLGKSNEILGTLKENWESTDVLLPIPEREILNNSNLGPQNLGY